MQIIELDKMRLDPKERITVEMYDKTARDWARTSDGMVDGKYLWQEAMDALPKWSALVPSQDGGRSSILDVGFGTGRDALLLASHYNYAGIDPSRGFLDVALEKTAGVVPSDAFGVMSVYNIHQYLPAGSFDLVWSPATLLHCSRRRMSEALINIRFALKPGGIAFISLKEGDGEEEDHYNGIPRWFTYWQHKEFSSKLRSISFKTVQFYVKPARIPFLCYFVQKV